MADFIVETTIPIELEGKLYTEDISEQRLFMGESTTERSSGARIVLITHDKVQLSFATWFGFKASNNAAECEALLAGLQLARELGVRKLKIYSDSYLIVGQVLGDFQARKESMSAYLQKADELLGYFVDYNLKQIPRELNKKADALARLASATDSELS